MNNTKSKIDTEELWKLALAQIEVKLDNPVQYTTWFVGTKLIGIENDVATVGVKNHYSADWLRRKHHPIVVDTLGYIYGKDLKVEYQISEELANETIPSFKPKEKAKIQDTPSLLDITGGTSNELHTAITTAKLNPKYTLENFVVGESNKVAHAAGTAVAQNPGSAYNPLFVYGRTGLGKTHIAHAVAIRILEKGFGKKVIYIPAEGFMNEMVKAIRSGKNIKFREKYRDTVDVLIIDDIQYISSWGQTQTEFFNTFNALQAAGKQIIIISDRPPDELEKLTPRLKSRFQGGIVVEISKPDYEHRIAIIEQKLKSLGVVLEREYVEFIAKNVSDNIRELEGGLQKVVLMHNLQANKKLTLEEIAKQLGKDVITKRKKVGVNEVIKSIAKEFDISVSDIKSPKRTAEVALARQICMFILRKELNYKLEEIAQFLNRKDHTTIMHGIDKIASKRMHDEVFRTQVVNIVDNIMNF